MEIFFYTSIMKMPPSSIPENRNSSLLTIDENQQVFQLLGYRCQVILTHFFFLLSV